jgi:hypothetical protein
VCPRGPRTYLRAIYTRSRKSWRHIRPGNLPYIHLGIYSVSPQLIPLLHPNPPTSPPHSSTPRHGCGRRHAIQEAQDVGDFQRYAPEAEDGWPCGRRGPDAREAHAEGYGAAAEQIWTPEKPEERPRARARSVAFSVKEVSRTALGLRRPEMGATAADELESVVRELGVGAGACRSPVKQKADLKLPER